MLERPKIVVLCGSTRFKDEFIEASKTETFAGRIVLSVGTFGHLEGLDMNGPLKVKLDELHLRKIDLADEVLVINPKVIVCGLCGKPTRLFTEAANDTNCCRSREWKWRTYIGESTAREIAYAKAQQRPIRWLVGDGNDLPP